jgi:hypothetical protein
VRTPLSRPNSSAAATQSTGRISWPPKTMRSSGRSPRSRKSGSSLTRPVVPITPALMASTPATAQVATLPQAPTIQTPVLRSIIVPTQLSSYLRCLKSTSQVTRT